MNIYEKSLTITSFAAEKNLLASLILQTFVIHFQCKSLIPPPTLISSAKLPNQSLWDEAQRAMLPTIFSISEPRLPVWKERHKDLSQSLLLFNHRE